jgi:hypothetical protein
MVEDSRLWVWGCQSKAYSGRYDPPSKIFSILTFIIIILEINLTKRFFKSGFL